jgi:hypothetical protein
VTIITLVPIGDFDLPSPAPLVVQIDDQDLPAPPALTVVVEGE